MAIKKSQNDYTTPEQSKRLLELGVPEDSANYCYECSLIGGEKYYSREHLDDTTFTEYKRNWDSPCVYNSLLVSWEVDGDNRFMCYISASWQLFLVSR